MEEFWTNEFFLYLALVCLGVAFFFFLKSQKMRKKELEWRKSLSDRIRGKFDRNSKSGTSKMDFGE